MPTDAGTPRAWHGRSLDLPAQPPRLVEPRIAGPLTLENHRHLWELYGAALRCYGCGASYAAVLAHYQALQELTHAGL